MRITHNLAAALAAAGALSAQFTTSGTGCTSPATCNPNAIFEVMPTAGWDLDGQSITFMSTGTSWFAMSGGAFIAPSGGATALPAMDDTVTPPLPLPFTFTYPGGAGSSTAIAASSNGQVYFEAGTITGNRCCSGVAALPFFLTETPSAAVLGTDLNPSTGGTWTFDTQTIGPDMVALVTWTGVPEYPTVGANTMQCQLWSTGNVVISHVTTNAATSTDSALVGVSVGGQVACTSTGIDLSTGLPHSPAAPFGSGVPISLSASGSFAPGGTFTITANNLTPGANAAALQFASGLPAMPLPLSLIGAPVGCDLQVDPIYYTGPMTLSGSTASLGVTTPCNPASVGLTVHLQTFVADLSQFGFFAIPVFVSNVGSLTLEPIPPTLRFVCEGTDSFASNAARGGFFRLESNCTGGHRDIIRLRVSLVGVAQAFDTDGNAGPGQFDHGNGATPAPCTQGNAFYGSDLTTGLVYGAPGQLASQCDPAGFMGWVGSAPGAASVYDVVDFEFAPGMFLPGERFGFDCDTDGGTIAGGTHAATVTVTFSDLSTVMGTTAMVSATRAEVVLIP